MTKKEKQLYAMLSLLSGATVNLSDIFGDEELKNSEKPKVSFDGKFEEEEEKYESILGERFELIGVIKAVTIGAFLQTLWAMSNISAVLKLRYMKSIKQTLLF